MSKVFIAGVGSTRYGAFPEQTVRSLSLEAVDNVLLDTGINADEIQKIFFANAAAGVISQQEMVRGQVALRNHPLAGTPLINVENACASGGSALHLAARAVEYGELDVVLVIGVEKLHHVEKERAFKALWGSADVDEIGEYPAGQSSSSVLMDFYAGVANQYLESWDATVEDYALLAVKNRNNAALNPIAQFRTRQTLAQVLSSRMIAVPLTLPMCAPLTDGASAVIVCSAAFAKQHGLAKIAIRSCEMSGSPSPGISPVISSSQLAYEKSGLSAADMDLIELHDAAAPAEILQYSEIGLCREGEGHILLRDGETEITGRHPVNTSGGLLSRGHALGATGCAQLSELYDQLIGRAGERQLQKPRLGMAVNGGGWMSDTYILSVTTILERIN
jgi:acetyl-CoA acyltransferase